MNMETVLVQLKHAKAKQLLLNLEELDIIEIKESTQQPVSESTKVSDLRKMMKPPFETNEEIDKQLEQLRNEWERDF
jgi:hypothetical protein